MTIGIMNPYNLEGLLKFLSTALTQELRLLWLYKHLSWILANGKNIPSLVLIPYPCSSD